MDKKIMVERETFSYNNKDYFSYCIKGQIRGTDVRIGVTPPDKGGFTVLDIVYADEMEAELVLKPYEIKDEKTGKVTSGNTYAVRSMDEDGNVYECPIKPMRASDRSLLNMLLR
jgi:hypothetical protein